MLWWKCAFFKKSQKKSKKGLHFEKPSAIITYVAGRHGGHKLNMGAFPSGQWGQTVNLLLNASVVRIHQLPPKRTRNLGCGFFFVLELVGFEQVGRPQTAKNSPADCFLDRGLRIHQLPPKSCGKDVAAAFFLCCIEQNRQRQWPIFKVRFIEKSNCFRAVGFFCCQPFLLLSEC